MNIIDISKINRKKQLAMIEKKEVLSTTDLSKLFGFTVSIAFLHSLGISEHFSTKYGYYWLKSDLNEIKKKIAVYLLKL